MALKEDSEVLGDLRGDFHLNILRFGRTRPEDCKKCSDKYSFPKVSSWIREEYRLMTSHSRADGGVYQQ